MGLSVAQKIPLFHYSTPHLFLPFSFYSLFFFWIPEHYQNFDTPFPPVGRSMAWRLVFWWEHLALEQ